MLSLHWGFLTFAMYHHRESIIKLTHYDETKKRAHDSQKVRAKENLKLSHGGPSQRQAAGTHRLIKALCHGCHWVWSLSTYDFSTSYTTLLQDLIKEKRTELIEQHVKREVNAALKKTINSGIIKMLALIWLFYCFHVCVIYLPMYLPHGAMDWCVNKYWCHGLVCK